MKQGCETSGIYAVERLCVHPEFYVYSYYSSEEDLNRASGFRNSVQIITRPELNRFLGTGRSRCVLKRIDAQVDAINTALALRMIQERVLADDGAQIR